MDKRFRTLAIGLALSLALNLFLGGAIASWSFRAREDRAGGPKRDRPPGARIELSRQQRQRLRPGRRALRAARKQLQVALGTDPLDEPALKRSLSELRLATEQTQKAMHSVLVEKAQTVDPERRRHLIRLTQAPTARRRGARGRGRREPR